MRPFPFPFLSERNWNARSSVPNVAPEMSGDVFPSPVLFAGSLLEIETSFTVGWASQASDKVMLAVMSTILWFGGQRLLGLKLTSKFGGVVSRIVTTTLSDALAPLVSVTVS